VQLLASALKRWRTLLQWGVLVLLGLRWALLAKASQVQREARPGQQQARRRVQQR
jgi:hypothetical protein